MTKAIIVGSGPSAKGFKSPDGVAIIAVNGVIDWIDRADFFVTTDHSEANMKRLQNRRECVEYCVAFPDQIAVPAGVKRYRRNEAPKVKTGRTNSPEWWFHRWGCLEGLTYNPDALNSGNSAYAALNLAYHLGFDDVALVGIDGTKDERVDGTGKPNNLSHLPMLFESALHQIQITNLGLLKSKLIPIMTLKEWLAK